MRLSPTRRCYLDLNIEKTKSKPFVFVGASVGVVGRGGGEGDSYSRYQSDTLVRSYTRNLLPYSCVASVCVILIFLNSRSIRVEHLHFPLQGNAKLFFIAGRQRSGVTQGAVHILHKLIIGHCRV